MIDLIFILEENRMKKGNLSTLMPIGVFLVLFLGIGIVTQDFL